MSEGTRDVGWVEELTFDPGRPISPWRRTNEGREDGVFIRAERNTRTSVENYIRDASSKYKPQKIQTFSPFGPLTPGNPLWP